MYSDWQNQSPTNWLINILGAIFEYILIKHITMIDIITM